VLKNKFINELKKGHKGALEEMMKYKKGEISWRILFGILGVLLILIGLFIVGIIPKQNTNQKIDRIILDDYSNVSYPHYSSLPITYKIINQSNDKEVNYKIKQIRKAFNIIENETIIKFKETNLTPNIKIYLTNEDSLYSLFPEVDPCHNKKLCLKYIKNELGGLAVAENIKYYDNIIENYSIYFIPFKKYSFSSNGNILSGETWVTGSCPNYPYVEIHEILHAIGFEHINNESSIMSPIFKIKECTNTPKLDKEIIRCINLIYSNKNNSLCSGLLFNKNEACETGTYISINSKGCCPEKDMWVDKEDYCVY